MTRSPGWLIFNFYDVGNPNSKLIRHVPMKMFHTKYLDYVISEIKFLHEKVKLSIGYVEKTDLDEYFGNRIIIIDQDKINVANIASKVRSLRAHKKIYTEKTLNFDLKVFDTPGKETIFGTRLS